MPEQELSVTTTTAVVADATPRETTTAVSSPNPTKTFENDDPSKLTEIELAWAKEVKETILKENEALAKEFTDLEYAQLAIVTKGKLKRAMKMIHRLSKFKTDHRIVAEQDKPGTMSDAATAADKAMEVIQKFENGSKGFLLGFGKDNATGRSVSVWNYAAFNPRSYKTSEEWATCFAAFYYLCEASAPDIATIRSGMAVICDCDDMGWRNFSLEIEKHGAALFQDCYPLRTKEMTMLHAPIILRAMYALCKPFLKQHTKDIFRMDGKVEEIQERYPKTILPKILGGIQGNWDMNDKLAKALKLRYETKLSFTL